MVVKMIVTSPAKREVTGSNPVIPRDVAQRLERLRTILACSPSTKIMGSGEGLGYFVCGYETYPNRLFPT